MPDIITDRKLTQSQAQKMIAPMELDLTALFKIIQEDFVTGIVGFKGTPEEYIDKIMKTLTPEGEVGEKAIMKTMIFSIEEILKGKALPPGTRSKRSDGIYVKQPDGSWLKETEKKEEKKEEELNPKTKEIMKKIDSLKEGDSFKIDVGTKIKKGYHEFNKFELSQYHGRIIQTFPNSKILAKVLSGEINGIEFKQPKVTNKKVNIVDINESDYTGQDMKWTEEFDHYEVLEKEMVAYHYSDKPINNFAEKETCFFPDPYDYTDIGYQITIPPGTKIKWYKSGELRLEIDKNMIIKQLEKGWSDYNEIK